MTDLVSVIIPVHNSAKFLNETLNSTLAQEYKELEIIVVNDGSTDQSAQIIDQFVQRDERIRLITQENLGVSKARNTGIEASSGRFVAFLDADDVWLPTAVASRIKAFENAEFGMVHSNAGFIDSVSREIPGTLRGKEGNLLNSMLLWEGPSVPGPSSVIIRRSVLDEVGYFDPELSTAADMDLFIRIAATYTIGHVDEVNWLYRIHENNMHSNIEIMEKDVLSVYAKVDKLNLFESKSLRRKAYGTMYRIVGASWIGDGNSPSKGLYYMMRSFLIYPKGLTQLLKRGGRKLRSL